MKERIKALISFFLACCMLASIGLCDMPGAVTAFAGDASETTQSSETTATTTETKYKDPTIQIIDIDSNTQAVARAMDEDSIDTAQNSSSNKKTKKIKKVAYVGDSLMTGFGSYYYFSRNGNKVIAKVGDTMTGFYSSGRMKTLLKYNPDRMFIMLGMNCVGGTPSNAQLNSLCSQLYRIVDKCLKKNPNMDVIVMGVSPIKRHETIRNSTIKAYNLKLKKAAAKRSQVRYYNTWETFSKNGKLDTSLIAGDGVHWQSSVYKKLYNNLQKYVKEY